MTEEPVLLGRIESLFLKLETTPRPSEVASELTALLAHTSPGAVSRLELSAIAHLKATLVRTAASLGEAEPQHAAIAAFERAVLDALTLEIEAHRSLLVSGELRGERLIQLLERYTDPALGRTFQFDDADTFVEELLGLGELPARAKERGEEMLPYQPTCVRLLLAAAREMAPNPGEEIIDVGAGVGRSGVLLHLLTGAPVHQIEFEPSYSRLSTHLARRWGLREVTAWCGDAAAFDYGRGDIFFLFNPFGGETLDTVVGKLEQEARSRPLTICSLGHCSKRFREASWLVEESGDPDGTLVVFRTESRVARRS